MSYVSDAHRFRKTMAGLCMIGAPVLFLLGSLLTPGFSENEATQVGLIAADEGMFLTATVMQLAGWGLFLVAVMAMMHMLREKGARDGHVGGTLALIGTVCALAQTGFLLALWQVAKTDQAAATSMLSGFDGIAQALLFFVPLGVTLGGIVLSWALYRHHFVAPWMAAAIGISAVCFLLGSVTFSQELYIAASALLLVGFGALGSMILRESMEEWEHTPEFHGLGISR
jgi:hypothetical protein